MRFELENKITPWDFFLVSMKKTYTSPIGVCNIIFTLASILLTAKFYNSVGDFAEMLLLFMCLIFPVFQPVMVYFRAKTQVSMIPSDMKYIIDDDGILIIAGGKSELVKWNRVDELLNKGNMLIIRVDKRNGYFLKDKALGDRKDDFIKFAEGKILK